MRCVTDTNIWIDLKVGGLLGSVFELDAVWMIPDMLLKKELRTPAPEMLLDWGLEHRSLNGEEIERVMEVSDRYPRPSAVDLATLVLADVEGALLITGDGPLRDAAKEEGIEYMAAYGL